MPKSTALDWAIHTPEGAMRFLSERGIEPSRDSANGTVGFTKHINESAVRVIKEALDLTTKKRVVDVREGLRDREDWGPFRKKHRTDYS